MASLVLRVVGVVLLLAAFAGVTWVAAWHSYTTNGAHIASTLWQAGLAYVVIALALAAVIVGRLPRG